MLLYDSLTSKLRSPKEVQFVDRVIEMAKTSNYWDVIREMVKYWEGTNPKEFKSLLVDVKEKKETRANSTGSSATKQSRYLVDIPGQLYLMIKVIYPDIIHEKDFFREFAKRFPQYRVAERI